MIPHVACPMREASQIGDARRRAARLAEELGFDEVAAGRLALVVTELATNLVRHAQEGTLLIGRRCTSEEMSIELISMDRGPGMRDIHASMRDGFSTSGTPGTGLGAVQRLSNRFIAFSKVGNGTIIVSRVSSDHQAAAFSAPTNSRFSIGGISVAAPGETVSGDAWAHKPAGSGVALIMADGLGHGPDAATASDEAVDVFERKATSDPIEMLEMSHAALRSTRGAAVAAATVDLEKRSVSFCGAGNISARLINGLVDRSLMSQHGTVGLLTRPFQAITYELPEHAMLLMHSDGITTRWTLKDIPELLLSDPVVIAAFLIREHIRGKDDATVAVVRFH
jgi:anti-sigma regulatory factor (Ser/Thr protein kinase)